MLLVSWFVLAAVGRSIIFVWQRFPAQYVPTKFLKDVHACDLCSGSYIYPVLLWLGGLDVVSAVLYGLATSFAVWVFVRGMKTLVEPTTYVVK